MDTLDKIFHTHLMDTAARKLIQDALTQQLQKKGVTLKPEQF
ncbi:MAG: hypothetical protein JWQ02_2986, partial [Capsulimonas sp.]|nr:hypothetical protein [Capsulimonas sp.]